MVNKNRGQGPNWFVIFLKFFMKISLRVLQPYLWIYWRGVEGGWLENSPFRKSRGRCRIGLGTTAFCAEHNHLNSFNLINKANDAQSLEWTQAEEDLLICLWKHRFTFLRGFTRIQSFLSVNVWQSVNLVSVINYSKKTLCLESFHCSETLKKQWIYRSQREEKNKSCHHRFKSRL